MRAVLDPNVLIAALLSRTAPPARIVARWLAGVFELVASETLLAELERALAYPRLRERISPGEASTFVSLLTEAALVTADPANPERRSVDAGDDYLLALRKPSVRFSYPAIGTSSNSPAASRSRLRETSWNYSSAFSAP